MDYPSIVKTSIAELLEDHRNCFQKEKYNKDEFYRGYSTGYEEAIFHLMAKINNKLREAI
ncbi:MAG: hypothetical protein NUV45_06405 [Tepidanaerobacteraceae bacterium]|jgi:hypothetical protein|nr:hypothetical protein [Tepidanaerobacteraceae bacterium]